MDSRKIKIVFIGTVFFSKKVLEKLLLHKLNVVGVCAKRKSKFNSDYYDLGKLCKKNKILIKYTNDINSISSIKWIHQKKPDILLCCGWSQILKKRLLNLPKFGSIGYHPSDLPDNRGRHPLIWTIILGLQKIHSTFFKMSEFADFGKILSKKSFIIKQSDNAGTLYKKICETAPSQLLKLIKQKNFLKILKEKNSFLKKPNTNYWRKRNFFDGKIDWRMTAKSIQLLVKGLSLPYVNAHFDKDKKDIKVLSTKIINYPSKNIEPGKIIGKKNNKFIIKCGENAILLDKIKPNIKLTINDYLT
jgi:methionyl-tRNA formyltransferase